MNNNSNQSERIVYTAGESTCGFVGTLVPNEAHLFDIINTKPIDQVICEFRSQFWNKNDLDFFSSIKKKLN